MRTLLCQLSQYHLVSFYYVLRTCSKVIEAFSDVSVKKNKIWKTIENANVDGEHLETKTLFSNVSGLM